MTVKIFKGIFLTSLVVLIASFTVFFVFSYDYYNDRLEGEVRREAEYLQKGYDEAESGKEDEFLSSLRLDGAFVTLIESDGRVIFDSRVEDAATLSNHASREEVREALVGGEGFSVRYSEVGTEKTIYCARRTEDGRVIRVGAEHFSAADVLAKVIGPTLLLLLGVLIFAFSAAAIMARSIIKPINEIDLDEPENTKTYEELTPIIKKLASQNYRIARQMNELRKRETEFNSITGNMSEGMVVINSHTEILSCNRSARLIFGISDGEPLGGILEINPEDSFRAAVSAALSGKNGYDSLRIGDKFYTLLVTPVFNGASVDGAVIVVIDETEKEARESLRREFTANVSHELKTPLTAIVGFAELISTGIADAEDTRKFAASIQKESKRLISLVGDIIRLNQLDGGEIPFDEEPISLFKCSEEVISRLESIAHAAGIALENSGEEVLVRGNRQILEEIIYNLCDNAIKYNKVGGRVEILTEKCPEGARLTVKDTGIGIPKDKLDRVFERFFRVDKSHSKNIGGTGLGLSIVKHAAAYHKASIKIESTEGSGTVIEIVFPDAV